MLKENAKRIRRLYGIALSIALAAAGICLMAQCVNIYRSGEFTRQIAAAHFSSIRVPVFVCLAMAAGGLVLELCLPREAPRRKADRQDELILQRLYEKADLNQCGDTLKAAILAQRKQRRVCRGIRTGLILLCSAVVLCYALNGSNYGNQAEITPSVIRAMYVLLPCCAVSFGWAVFTAYRHRASVRREIDLLKQAPLSSTPVSKADTGTKGDRARSLRRVILAAAIAVLIYGYFTGGTNDVLTKAVNICTECVGLG